MASGGEPLSTKTRHAYEMRGPSSARRYEAPRAREARRIASRHTSEGYAWHSRTATGITPYQPANPAKEGLQLVSALKYSILRPVMQTSPHPLDFDWRFEQATVDRLCSMLAGGKRVLALGAPSIARRLERISCDVMLLDRQPEFGLSRHIVADIDLLVHPISGFDTAIVDPPWYVDNLVHWTMYAASCVGPGGTVLSSAWPASARPGADDELNHAIATMSEWASVRQLPIHPEYEIPRFERLAIEVGGPGPLSVSPRKGILLELSVTRKPERLAPLARPEIWQRFVIDGYQLAIRLGGPEAMAPRIARHSASIGWRWPFVSARAPGRSEIGLWSSDGEVAVVSSVAAVAELLRRAISSDGREEFERALRPLPDLLSWNIPYPPYRSLLEWQHRQ
jgi:hypothetical protein